MTRSDIKRIKKLEKRRKNKNTIDSTNEIILPNYVSYEQNIKDYLLFLDELKKIKDYYVQK